MAIKFLSSENIAGDIDVNLSKNGITYLAVTNTNTGVSANARVQVVGESSQIDIIATSAGYTGVTGWADSGIISTDSGASGGLKLNSQVGGIQLQSGTTSYVTMSASGTVGIGTTSPTARLDVLTNSATGDNNIDRTVRFRADNGEQRFNFFVGRSGNSSNLQMYDSGEVVKVVLNTSDNSYFNGGNLGIGTASPENKLHILRSSSDTESQLMVQNGSTGDAAIKFNVSGQSYVIGIDQDDSSKFKIASSSNLGTTDRVTLLSSGNVGIGTISPGRKLTVTGDASGDANNLLLSNENDTNGDSASIGFSMLSNNTYVKAGIFFQRITTQGRGDLIFANNNEVNGNNVGITNEIMSIRNTGAIEIKGTSTTLNGKAFITNTDALMTIGSTQSSGVPKDMAFFNGAERMRIQATTGNVGIGVTSPAGKLEVAGGSTYGFRLSNAGDQSAYDQVRFTYGGYNSGAPTVTFMPLTTPGSGNVDTTFHFMNTNGLNSNNNRANVNIDGILYVGSGRQSGETTLIMRNYDDTLVNTGSIQNSIRMSGRYWSGSASQLVETRINSVHQESNGNGGSALTFWTQTGGSTPNEKLRIDKSGRVIVYQKENVSGFYLDGGNTRLYANGGGGTDYRGIECNSSGMWSWGETGTSNYFAKKVGIGTTTFAPTTNLQLKLGDMASGAVGEIFDAVDNADNSRIIIGGGNDGSPQFSMRHYSAAYGFDIWMNVNSPWDTYMDNRQVNSGFIWRNNCNADGSEVILMDLDGNSGAGTLTVKGDIVAYGSPSDKRLKENIKPIESALDKVSKLQGVTFDWKKSDSILDIKKDIGFIAQDVQKVVPELVRENEDGMLSMRHQGVTPILLEAIKELKAEIEELKKQIN